MPVTSPTKTQGVAEGGDKQNGDADDEALPPKKRKKIQISREPLPDETVTPAVPESTPASGDSAATPMTGSDATAKPKTHALITGPSSAGEKVVKLAAEALAGVDKAKLRQEKFGTVTVDPPAKPKGKAPVAAVVAGVDEEKVKKRSEKFGATGAQVKITAVGKVSVSLQCLFILFCSNY